MFVRACCLLFLCVSLTTGCQIPATALFPCADDSSDLDPTEPKLNFRRDELSLSTDAVTDTVQTPIAESDAVKDTQIDNLAKERLEHVQSWLRRGHEAILQAAGNARPEAMLSEARRSFREALKIDPECAEAFHGLAIVSDLNQDWELADISYKRALAIRPNDVDLLNDQGYSYLLQNRYHEASQYLNRALQVSPGHEKAHINLAILDIRRGHQDTALVRLENVYPAVLARNALASLTEQYLPVAPGGDHGSPFESAENSGTLLAGPGRPQHMYPSNRTPQNSALQGGGLNSGQCQLTEPQLFSQNSFIRTQPSHTAVQPVGAADRQLQPIRVSPTTMHRSADETLAQREPSAPSPLNSARTVGRTFRMPTGQNIMRTSLPPAANVYHPDSTSDGFVQPSSGGQDSAKLPLKMSALNTGSAPLFNEQPTQSQQLQHQQLQRQQPFVQNHFGQQSRGQQIPDGPLYGGTGKMNNFPSAGSFPIPVSPPPSSGNSVNPAPQTGSFYSNLDTRAPQVQSSPNQPGVNSPYVTPQTINPSHGFPAYPHEPIRQMPAGSEPQGAGMVYPAGWAQSTAVSGVQTAAPGQHMQGSPGQQWPNGSSAPTRTTAPIAPGYFSPPPLMGLGYRDPSEPSPDRLAEYRKTRQQLGNEYNQTLQRIGQPIGGQSIP